jgi:hypothetical protein
MRKTGNTFAMNTGANGGDWRAERIGLLRDMAERLARGNGVDSHDACRQLRAIDHAARQFS